MQARGLPSACINFLTRGGEISILHKQTNVGFFFSHLKASFDSIYILPARAIFEISINGFKYTRNIISFEENGILKYIQNVCT
jgi:hypothetical protein